MKKVREAAKNNVKGGNRGRGYKTWKYLEQNRGEGTRRNDWWLSVDDLSSARRREEDITLQLVLRWNEVDDLRS